MTDRLASIDAPRMPSAAAHALPAGACDTHTHIFGPYDRFPFVIPPTYPPVLAPFELHREMLARVGAARSVLVQPAPYADDPSALLDALRRARGSARGIVVASNSVTDKTLQTWHDAGVRGLRFTEVTDSATGQRFAGSVGVTELTALAPRLKELGWHAQIWAPGEHVDRIARMFEGTGVSLVFEHMAGISVREGPKAAQFQRIVQRLKDGCIWIKLDLCRVSRAVPDYADARPFHDALIEANASRLLWASDWPFVRLGDLAPDVAHLVDLFRAWVQDGGTQDAILVNSPRELYGFEEGSA